MKWLRKQLLQGFDDRRTPTSKEDHMTRYSALLVTFLVLTMMLSCQEKEQPASALRAESPDRGPIGRSAAKDPDSGYQLPEGTRPVAFHLHKDQEVPNEVKNGMEIDIIGEISEPIKTSIALLNVKLLAMDPKFKGREQAVTVQLTPAQSEVLYLMQKHGTKLSIRLHPKEKLKK